MEYREHWVSRGGHYIYAGEYGGEGPVIFPVRCFPDSFRLYDRL